MISIIRRIFLQPTEEDLKPKYVPGKPTPHRHHAIEEQEQRDRGWLQTDAWRRLSGR